MRIITKDRLFAGTLIWLVISSPANSQSSEPKTSEKPKISVLDLIPAEACGVFAVRNLNELKERGDTFIERTGTQSPLRPSQLFPMAYARLGITDGIDEDGPAALMILRYEDPEAHLVLAISFDDRDAIASNFGLKGSDLVEGKVVKRKSKKDLRGWPQNISKFVTVRGDHMICGSSEKAVSMMFEAKSLKSQLSQEEQQVLEQSDLIGHISMKGWGTGWLAVIDEVKKYLLKAVEKEDPRVAAGLVQAVEQLKMGTIGVRFDDGLGVHLLMSFVDEKPVRAVLSSLAGEGPGAKFDGLPTDRLVSAYGVSGAGALRVEMMRSALITTLKEVSPAREMVSAAKLPDLVNVLGEIAHRTQGRRVALYHNGDDADQGLLSVVGVLDTDDPEKFCADMQELAKYVSFAALEPDDDRRPKIEARTIDALIAQLGSDEFRKRNSAMTKLLLIGEDTMAALKVAATSTDPEIAFRARRLRTDITAKIEERRKGLLEQGLVGQLNPRFGYHVAAERRDGRTIDVVRIELQDTQEHFEESMKRFLGTQWKNVRVATTGKHVVVLIGSNTAVFEATLKNLEQNKPSLAEHPKLKTARVRHDPAGQFAIHFSMERLLAIVMPEKSRPLALKTGEAELTSCTLRIAPTTIRADAFAPFREVKTALMSQGLAKP